MAYWSYGIIPNLVEVYDHLFHAKYLHDVSSSQNVPYEFQNELNHFFV